MFLFISDPRYKNLDFENEKVKKCLKTTLHDMIKEDETDWEREILIQNKRKKDLDFVLQTNYEVNPKPKTYI